MQGETGVNLLQLLERRLDNVVYRLGLASTRGAARQLVNHGHFLVNNKKADVPSYTVAAGDEIKVRKKSRKLQVIHDSVKQIKGDLDSPWLALDKASLSGTVLKTPDKDNLDPIFKVQLVVELYSK